ncbi:hypothetical protein ACFQZS_03135 [Mucilaginibacter calamicampi]|uniref:Uncharacterized protein n=1 Tax=Mucilaginibacter calamicampi TaxID=1302352 RepID=A0ABW2YSC1_9SPHI
MIKRKARRTSKPTPIKAKPITQQGFGHEIPPEPALVHIYFEQAGFPREAQRFLKAFTGTNWCGPQGKPYRNWKVLASAWIKKLTR